MEKLKTFSHREWEVFQELKLGKTNKQIGSALGISEKTVKANVGGVMRKTGTKNRVQAAILRIEDVSHLVPQVKRRRGMKAPAASVAVLAP